MTILFTDGMDMYGSSKADMARQYFEIHTDITVDATLGRFGGGAMNFEHWNKWAYALWGTTLTTFTVSGAYKFSGGPTVTGTDFLRLRSGTNVHLAFRVAANGSIQILRNTTALGNSDSGVIIEGAWQWVSIKVTIDDAAGAVEIYVNNVQVADFTSIDTRNGGSASCDNAGFGGNTAGDSWWDDMIINDTNGAYNTGIIADTRIYTIMPDAVTSEEDFTSSAGGDNYTFVDDIPPDEDSTYVESSTPGDTDRYNFEALGVAPEAILAVVAKAVARKDDAGARSIRMIVENNSSEAVGPDIALSTTYANYHHIVESDPDSGTAEELWTEADVDAMTAGYEVV